MESTCRTAARWPTRWRARERIDKDALPTDEVFRRSGPPVLVLVTCGGAFDRSERAYAGNVVVVAEPIS